MKIVFEKILGYAMLAGILFGLFVIMAVPYEMYRKAEAEKWPSRRGVITTSYAHLKRGSAGSSGYAPWWRAEVCGKYSDNGERFCVSRIRYGGFRWGGGKADAFDTVASYPVGREVAVYYSPKNPRETVLEAHSSWKEMKILLGLGITFLLLPVILWLFRRQLEPERYGSSKLENTNSD
jgi:hypothetical protein